MSFVHRSPVSRPLTNEEENIDCNCQECLTCLVNSYELTVFDGYEGEGENEEHQVGGLIFSNKRDYEFFKKIDEKIFLIVGKLNKEEDGIKKLEELFDRIYELDVTETYEGAREEIECLFPNVIELLQYDDDRRFKIEYRAGELFFQKFNYVWEKTYSERKEELKESIEIIFDINELKINLRALYYSEELKNNWEEIRNMELFIFTLKRIVAFINDPNEENLDIVKYFCKSYKYSDKLLFPESFYDSLNVLEEEDDLYTAIYPLLNELSKGKGNTGDKRIFEISKNIFEANKVYNENDIEEVDLSSDSDSDIYSDTESEYED